MEWPAGPSSPQRWAGVPGAKAGGEAGQEGQGTACAEALRQKGAEG